MKVVKGMESDTFLSSTLAPASEAPTSTSAESTTNNNESKPAGKKKDWRKASNKRKQTSTTKGNGKKAEKNSKRRKGNNNAPKRKKSTAKRKKSKGKSGGNPNPKSFKPLKDLKLGSSVSGVVVDVCDFGAFVDIGYATRGSRAGTALLHISQITDERISSAGDVLSVGQKLEDGQLRVISVDPVKGEAGLSLRARRPRRTDFAKLEVGARMDGRVSGVVPYGAFVDVGANVNGLLHISRITGGAIENVRHHLNEGDSVSVHIVDIDRKRKKMAVSMLDKKADQYLDRRMSQRLKRYYGKSNGEAAAEGGAKSKDEDEEDVDESKDLEYFDVAIRELEEALQDRA